MANENARNLQDGTIQLADDNSANTLVIVCEEGNLTWSETHNVEHIKDRGSLDHMREGEQEPVSFSFSVRYKYAIASGSEPLSPYECFHQIGGASSWVSREPCGDVYSIAIKFTIADPCSTGEDEMIVFHRVPRPNINFEEGQNSDVMSFEGISYEVAPRIYRGSSTSTTGW